MTMKIQCACGAKYALEITPEMAANAPRFVCQQCGADNSSTLSEIIRQEFGEPSAAEPPHCARHLEQIATEECVVCKKPICPACMELFGYLCSPYCKAQAERLQIDVPFYERQKHVVENRFWKKLKYCAAAAALVAAIICGLWIWSDFSAHVRKWSFRSNCRKAPKDFANWLHRMTSLFGMETRSAATT